MGSGWTLRRKACEACVRRKVRCDLVRPCARCTARKEECVYAGGRSDDGPALPVGGSGASDADVAGSEQTMRVMVGLFKLKIPGEPVLDFPAAERGDAIARGSEASPLGVMTSTSGLSTEELEDPVLPEVAVAVSGFIGSDLDLDLDANFREENSGPVSGPVSAPEDLISATNLSSGPAPAAEETIAHAHAVIPQSSPLSQDLAIDIDSLARVDVNGPSGQLTNHFYPVSSLNLENLFSPFLLGGSDACGGGGGVASSSSVGQSTVPRPLGHPADSLSDADFGLEDAYRACTRGCLRPCLIFSFSQSRISTPCIVDTIHFSIFRHGSVAQRIRSSNAPCAYVVRCMRWTSLTRVPPPNSTFSTTFEVHCDSRSFEPLYVASFVKRGFHVI